MFLGLFEPQAGENGGGRGLEGFLVPVAPHGLIVGEDGATASRKPSKPLPPLFPPTWGPKKTQNIEIEELGGKYI